MSEARKCDQVCEICGTKLTIWNRSKGKQKCAKCARGIQEQQEYYEFFRLYGMDENSIVRYSLVASLRSSFGAALIWLLGSIAGAYVAGFFGAILGMMLAGWITRKMIYDRLYHPIDRKRYVAFFMTFYIVFWIAFFIVWSWLLVTAVGTDVRPPLIFIWLIACIPAVISGIIRVVTTDKKYKSDMLRYFREWQQLRKNI